MSSRSRRERKPPEPLYLALTEKQWQNTVVELARSLGYRTYHPWLSIRSERGWPDLAIFKPGRFLLAELKSEKGKLTPAQEEIIAELRESGVEVYIWRPSDFDTVAAILNGQKNHT